MGIGNRNSQHSFAQIPAVHQARSVFDRSYPVKDTYNFDYLNPVFVEEVLPGDTINLNVKSFFRLAPQVVPLMDNMYIDWFFFSFLIALCGTIGSVLMALKMIRMIRRIFSLLRST